jgi:iron complex outermembrane receptor protein
MKFRMTRAAASRAALVSAYFAASAASFPSSALTQSDGSAPAAAPDESGLSAAEPLATIAVVGREAVSTETESRERPSREIEEVIVTATKRTQSIRDIPASINAISGQSLEEGGKLNLIDFIEQTPGVTATQGNSGYTRFTMRGISTDTGQTSPSPSPVGVFIGDTAFTDPYIANIVPDLSAFDLSGIQVLKGPQGTLFGGAALSGAVRYELQEPVIGEWQARGFTQMVSPKGGSTAFTSGAAVNVPLDDDDLALRLVYVRRNYPGIFDDTRSGEKNVDHGSGNQYRGILLWKPQDWTFKLTHLSQDFYAPDAVYTSNTPDKREISSNIFDIPAKNSFGMDSLEGAYDFDSMRATSLSSYLFKKSVFNLDATSVLVGPPPVGYPPALGLLAPCTENSHAFSQELRLQSTGSDPFQWIVGGYFYTYSMYFNLLIDTPANQGLTGPDSALSDLLASVGLPVLWSATTPRFSRARRESRRPSAPRSST